MNQLKDIKRNTLFLWLNNDEYFAKEVNKNGVRTDQVYKKRMSQSKILRIFRRLNLETKIPFIDYLIGDWKKEINNYQNIIIQASKESVPVVKYIKNNYPNIRIIVWYWNPVEKTVPCELFDTEVWSFDMEDCKKFSLKYNTSFYFKSITLQHEKEVIDCFFLGGDKGRINDLLMIEKKMINQGIHPYLHITKTSDSGEQYSEIYKPRISYMNALSILGRSKAIIDYVSSNQVGLTLRPLEAIFLKKKLITNDVSITNRDFYCKDNIFILGVDDYNGLKNFLSTPYKDLSEDIVYYYDFDNWLLRFFI
jgi:hypothetical protein